MWRFEFCTNFKLFLHLLFQFGIVLQRLLDDSHQTVVLFNDFEITVRLVLFEVLVYLCAVLVAHLEFEFFTFYIIDKLYFIYFM